MPRAPPPPQQRLSNVLIIFCQTCERSHCVASLCGTHMSRVTFVISDVSHFKFRDPDHFTQHRQVTLADKRGYIRDPRWSPPPWGALKTQSISTPKSSCLSETECAAPASPHNSLPASLLPDDGTQRGSNGVAEVPPTPLQGCRRAIKRKPQQVSKCMCCGLDGRYTAAVKVTSV